MVTIIFKGQFETENQEDFINKLQEILDETDTSFIGRVDAYEMPKDVDFQKVESKIINESEDKSETITDTSNSDSNI